jgi:hypothetical protein
MKNEEVWGVITYYPPCAAKKQRRNWPRWFRYTIRRLFRLNRK